MLCVKMDWLDPAVQHGCFFFRVVAEPAGCCWDTTVGFFYVGNQFLLATVVDGQCLQNS